MTALLSEAGLFGSLKDLNASQKQQVAHWLNYDHNRDSDPGVIRSAELILNRGKQGSSLVYAGRIIRAMLDERTGLDSSKSFDDRVAIALMDGGSRPCDILDNHFFNYLDGSLTVGYDQTGFMVDLDDYSTIIHPATRYAFSLTEEKYDLSHGQTGCVVTGRTLFFYRLSQACEAIVAAAKHEGTTP